MASISVVMSVYDEPEHVKKTIESVLQQEGVDFEFVIVSDGASDAVVNVVDSYAVDPRIEFIKQVNQGLTVALVNGCNHAQSPFIARIDAGDLMLPGRLKIQSASLLADESLGFVASWVSIETVEGYFLYDLALTDEQLNESIRKSNVEGFRAPFHASVMFRKSVYLQVGGYRPSFYFAQDCDLWSRMLESAGLKMIESVLTSGIFSAQGISGKHADEQRELLKLILLAAEHRRKNLSEKEFVDQAYQHRPQKNVKKEIATSDDFDGLYFIAKILTDNKSKHSLVYWRRVLKCRPFSVKSWIFSAKSIVNLLMKRNDSLVKG